MGKRKDDNDSGGLELTTIGKVCLGVLGGLALLDKAAENELKRIKREEERNNPRNAYEDD